MRIPPRRTQRGEEHEGLKKLIKLLILNFVAFVRFVVKLSPETLQSIII
jgi:hypothetical protein